MTLDEYGAWVANEVLKREPASLTADWGVTRTAAVQAIGRQGIFETISMCCALCEFFGCLYRGIRGNSGGDEFKAFVNDFFPPAYGGIHDLSGRAGSASEFYTVFRSKLLHGGTPAAVTLPGNASVIGWCIGFDQRGKHLNIISGNLHLDGDQLREDLAAAVREYARRLGVDPALEETWRRGFWWRFRPLYLPEAEWEREGRKRGIPA